MSQEIIIPGKPFGGIFAVSEFAKVLVFLFLAAVAGGHMAMDISSPVKLMITCLIRAREISAMSLDMFANRIVSILHIGNRNVKDIAVRTGAHASARIACGRLDRTCDLAASLEDLERQTWGLVFYGLDHGT